MAKPRKKMRQTRDFLPIIPFVQNGIYLSAPPLLKAAIMNCILTWFVAGCPENMLEGSLETLSGLATMSYRRHEKRLCEAVMQIKTQVKSIYIRERDKLVRSLENRKQASETIRNYNARRTEYRNSDRKLAEAVDTQPVGLLPHFSHKKDSSTWQNDPKTDQIARQEAIKRVKSQKQTDFKPVFSDFSDLL